MKKKKKKRRLLIYHMLLHFCVNSVTPYDSGCFRGTQRMEVCFHQCLNYSGCYFFIPEILTQRTPFGRVNVKLLLLLSYKNKYQTVIRTHDVHPRSQALKGNFFIALKEIFIIAAFHSSFVLVLLTSTSKRKERECYFAILNYLLHVFLCL